MSTYHYYFILNGTNFQSELTTKGHEVIALKSEVRDLLQKLESKERRINELEGRRLEGRNSDNGGDGNNCNNDQLAADKLCSLVGRLNEQVSCWIVKFRLEHCRPYCRHNNNVF